MNAIIKILLLSGLIFSQNLLAENKDKIEKLMTFFTTQTERNALNKRRDAGEYDKKTAGKGSGPAILREPVKVELKGVMIREKSGPVVWVNNGNTLKSNKIDHKISVNKQLIKKDQTKVLVRVNQKKLRMKPGQQWNELDNKVKDKYQTKQ